MLYNLIITPFAVAGILASDIRSVIVFAIIPSSLLFAGISLLGYATFFELRRRKFGTSVCKPSVIPVKPGVEIQYNIRIPVRLTGINSVHCELLDYGAPAITSDEGTSTEVENLFDIEEPVIGEEQSKPANNFGNMKEVPLSSVQITGNETTFSVAFTLLPDAQPTMIADEEQNGRVWFLEIKAEREGLDYKALFEVPVFSKAADISRVSIKDALWRGSMIRWSMTFIGFSTTVIYALIMVLYPTYLEQLPCLIGYLIYLFVGWIVRCRRITKWKIWAYSNVDDIEELKKEALRQGIIYPEDHVLTQIEFCTRADKQKLAMLEAKSLNTKKHSDEVI